MVLDSSKEKSGSTIVTAYFDIKSKYSSSVYDTWMANMLSLQDAMVIYTTPDLVDTIRGFRKHTGALTHIIPMHLEHTKMATKYSDAFWKVQHAMDPEKSIHSPNLYKIWNEKSNWLKRASVLNPFHSNFFAWVDIGYFRSKYKNGKQILRRIPPSLQRNQVLTRCHVVSCSFQLH